VAVISDFGAALAAMVALALASAFFSCSEAALFSLQTDDRRKLRSGDAAQRAAEDLLRRPERLLSAILFWNLLVNVAFFALASVIGIQLEREGRRAESATLAVVSLFSLIAVGEMLPKTLGVQLPRALAPLVSFPLAFAVRALDGLMPLLSAVNRLLQRLLAPSFRREHYLEIHDLERAISLSTADQQLAAMERSALHNIVLLSELTAEELMRPRTQYRSYRPPLSLQELTCEAVDGGYVLVAEEDSDEVAGAIPLGRMTALPRQHLEQFARPVACVPWCAAGSAVLEQLQQQQQEVAAVVNEMGETIGIITLEDMLGAIFDGDSSRSARALATASIRQLAADRWSVTGFTNLRRLSRHFSLPLAPSRSLTVRGVLQEILQRMPVAGDEVVWGGFRFRVLDADRQESIRVEVTLPIEGATSS
jgi:CBS domain containing-hemolysin-like protein